MLLKFPRAFVLVSTLVISFNRYRSKARFAKRAHGLALHFYTFYFLLIIYCSQLARNQERAWNHRVIHGMDNTGPKLDDPSV